MVVVATRVAVVTGVLDLLTVVAGVVLGYDKRGV
jgi:hypothetical protein